MGVVLGFVGAFGVGFRQRLIDVLGDGQAVGEFQRLLEAIREPRAEILLDDDAVDHDVDVVLEFLVELRRVADLVNFAVDLDALVALLLPLGEFLAVFALAAAHDRGEEQQARAFGKRQHAIDHL